jgi:hypothetical protein
VILPAPDWIAAEKIFSSQDLAQIAAEKLGWQGAQVVLNGPLITYRWEDRALALRHDALDGALLITVVGFTIGDQPADPAPIQDQVRQLRDHLLLESIPSGPYHLENITYPEGGLRLQFLLPPA